MSKGEIKKKEVRDFVDSEVSNQNIFRTLIVFGKNVATYKFAFCHALLHSKPKSEIYYHELRDDFLQELISHYSQNTHQFTKSSNTLTNAMDIYLASSKSQNDWASLVKVAEKNIYNNVFDAFQNVGGGTLDQSYILFEHDKKNKKLILTERTNEIQESDLLKQDILNENQARWKIVEEAWKSKLSPNLLEYNKEDKNFYSISNNIRVNLRSAVDVLKPYQKGRCFYCNRKLNTFALKDDDDFIDVDHFFPISLLAGKVDSSINPNGVWNLVLACKSCNRGSSGKFSTPADERYFNKLRDRNILYTEEHKHSLKNSIFYSLGTSSKEGVSTKMKKIYNEFSFIKGWKPEYIFNIED